jgi:hypothetical protein
MMRRLATTTLTALLVLGTGGVAFADPDITGDGDTVTVGDSDSSSDQTGGPGSDSVYTVPKPYKEYRYIPACSQNDLDGVSDALCGGAVYTCPDDGDIRYRVYTRQHDADGSVADGADFEYQGTECRGPDDPPEGGPVQITTADIRDEATQAAPESVVHVEPGNRSYVNVPTNFYADTDTQDVTVQVLGQAVGLQFAPAGYTWAYGDGGGGSGAGIEGAPVGGPGAVEHAYLRSGDVSITLTRTYTVTFTLPGGQSGTLPAPAISNTSDPYPLEIGEIQSVVTKVR